MRKTRRTLSLALAVAGGLAFAAPVLAVETPDPWITTKVKAELLTAKDVDGLDIDVDTTDGRVTLHGQAGSAAEKARAEQLARQVSGVREVRNLIQVVPGASERSVTATDEEIRKRVEADLEKDPALAGVSIQSVNQGVVLLGGEAKTLSAHLRALEVARATPGVRSVESEIRSPDRLADAEIWRDPGVSAAPPSGVTQTVSDLWITSATKVRLLAADVSAMDINVDTRDGAVTLFGSVSSEAEKQAAAAEARKVDGVRTVNNELQVVPAPQREVAERQDAQIAKDVESRLEDRVRGSKIDVEVANGVVRLSGTVPSQGDRLAALTAARSSAGVRSVVGDLRVERD